MKKGLERNLPSIAESVIKVSENVRPIFLNNNM